MLASRLAARLEIVEIAQPHLGDLVETFRESAYLAVLRGGKGVFVDVRDAHRDFRLIGPLGAEVHYHATAAGKAMAAFFPAEIRASLLDPSNLATVTRRTVTDPARIDGEWAAVRERGFALNDEETMVGAAFVAAPIFDAGGTVCGSLSLGVPKARFSVELSRRIAEHIKAACRRLSEELRALGYRHVGGLDQLQLHYPDSQRKTLYA